MDEMYRHWSQRLVYTTSVKCTAEEHGAYWLIDAVASYQPLPRVKAEGFQVWRLEVNQDRTATLRMTDGNTDKAIVEQVIEFTDYPEAEAKWYCVEGDGCMVLMLPEDY